MQSLTEGLAGVAGFVPIRPRSSQTDSTDGVCPATAPETTFLGGRPIEKYRGERLENQ
jgi:hypothetical protein